MKTSEWKKGYEAAIEDMAAWELYASFKKDETEEWKAGYAKAIEEKQDSVIAADYYHRDRG